ncbi:LysR family transcriptional regulator [Tsukamurella soli]|uniref:LysR family transcriptional regulator n=1 Tax=Tsukamurella soli TaxID=644556 RepID=A0ABP8JV59_9ACTN
MDVERLRMLRELADRGTVHAAAEAMSLTSSAVSQQLKRLQREVGLELLEPDGRRLRLTEAGKVLVARADEVLAALDRARADMDVLRTTPRGTVRVAMVPSAAVLLLPGLITEAAAIDVQVIGRDIDQPAADALALLADYDVVVVDRDERDASDWSPRIDATLLFRETLEIVLRPDHHLADSEHIALHELAHCPWISVGIGHMVDDVLRSLAVQTGISPRIIQRINDFRVVEELVLAGVGVALLPRYTTTSGTLVRKPVDGVEVARRVEAVTRAGAVARPSVAAVIDILTDLAEQLVAERH